MGPTRHGPPDPPGKAVQLVHCCPSTRALLLFRRADSRHPLSPEKFPPGSRRQAPAHRLLLLPRRPLAANPSASTAYARLCSLPPRSGGALFYGPAG